MWNPINALPFLRDERNYPQFLNRKARGIVVFLLVAALMLPTFVIMFVVQVAQIRNNFVSQDTLITGLILASVVQIIFALVFVMPVFSKEKEKMIIDPDDLAKVIREAEEDPLNLKDPGSAILDHIVGLYETEMKDLEKQARNWDDLVVKRLRWRDMSIGKRILYVISISLPASLAAWSVALMLGLMPTHPRNPALDTTPNGRMMNEFFSGDYDFFIGLFIFVFSVIMGFAFYHIGRVDYRSKSEDALKKFMGEMGIE